MFSSSWHCLAIFAPLLESRPAMIPQLQARGPSNCPSRRALRKRMRDTWNDSVTLAATLTRECGEEDPWRLRSLPAEWSLVRRSLDDPRVTHRATAPSGGLALPGYLMRVLHLPVGLTPEAVSMHRDSPIHHSDILILPSQGAMVKLLVPACLKKEPLSKYF